MIILWIFLGLILLVGGYFSYLHLSAYLEVKAWPREPMFICDRHGPINKDYVIKFQSAPDTWIDYCSLCFHERLSGAEKIK